MVAEPSEGRSTADGQPMGEALRVLSTTRAIRRYTVDPIPEADLATMLWHATRAPTGSNRQAVRYLVLRDGPQAAAARALLGNAFRAGWAAKQVGSDLGEGSGVGLSARALAKRQRTAAAMQHYVDHFEQIPAVVLVCLLRYRAANPYEGASVYPSCQNLLLAARALGYGGALTMWHQSVEPELRLLLGIPEEAAVSACITLGRPVGRHGPVRRRPLGEVVFDDAWGHPAQWATDYPEDAT